MNCREAHTHLFAERDGALEDTRRAALDGHVAECAACRRIRDDLAAALTAWRTNNAKTPVPDAEREWHAVRRIIRGGAEAGAARPGRRTLLPWLVTPLGAAAALALAFYAVRNPSPAPVSAGQPGQVARVESIEVPGNAATTVFVDDKSGWLIVLASDSPKEI